MRNITTKLLNSYDLLLGGALSVPVYIESVPDSETGNYVLLRMEGITDVDNNDKTWIKEAVLVCDIVTQFDTVIDIDTVDSIYNEIGVLLADGHNHLHNLSAQTGMIINSVTEETGDYLQEDDGVSKIYRKIIRLNHLITIQI